MNQPLSVAGTFKRAIAYFIDKLVGYLFFLPLLFGSFSSILQNNVVELEIRWLVLCYFSILLYHVLFLKFMGATLGKLLLGLKVISTDNTETQELSWAQAILRVVTDQFSLFFGLAHRMLVFARFDRTHLSDWVAHTRVIQYGPQMSQPSRNIPIAILLVLIFMYSGFISVYRTFQRSEIAGGKIIMHPMKLDIRR